MSSCGKRKEIARVEEELTGTSSETVNTSDFVNKVLTLQKFKAPLQRISEKHRLKAEEVAERHGKRYFNEVLDIYVFCYEYMLELSSRLNVPLYKLPDELEKYIPTSEVDVIAFKLSEMLDEINLNGKIRSKIEPLLFKILFTAKISKDKKVLEEIERVMAVLGIK